MPITVTQQAGPIDASALSKVSLKDFMWVLFIHGNLRKVGGMLNINPLNLTWSNFSLWVRVNWYELKLLIISENIFIEKNESYE